ncbi:unnamed protein product [marine sediment metagenome]|uniref:Uncharacterized protein n=1 Tax=marine sediment metagenome TaxID=412755 RepID=X1N7K6_9ZZZZ
MPASDVNDRIAKAKGWTYIVTGNQLIGIFIFWRNPEGKPAHRPNFTGTLEGVAGMMRELQDWNLKPCGQGWLYWRTVPEETHFVPENNLGICVGEVWISQHEKEANASTAE